MLIESDSKSIHDIGERNSTSTFSVGKMTGQRNPSPVTNDLNCKEQYKKIDKAALEERAINLLERAISHVEPANKTRDFRNFMDLFNEMATCLEEASRIQDYLFTIPGIHGSIRIDYNDLMRNKQKHIRDAIGRASEQIIDNSKNKYRNNKDETIREYESLRDALSFFNKEFDDTTSNFADLRLNKIINDCDLYSKMTLPSSEDLSFDSFCEQSFDSLNGHEFEQWCANLLRRNGFKNVEVTQSSGDQGVDILAEKDDIRYAIQCKCYSRKLDNTPVQEVSAGRAFYNCHIGVVMTNNYFTYPAQQLAKATGILLWDRDRILKLCENIKNQPSNSI